MGIFRLPSKMMFGKFPAGATIAKRDPSRAVEDLTMR